LIEDANNGYTILHTKLDITSIRYTDFVLDKMGKIGKLFTEKFAPYCQCFLVVASIAGQGVI